MSFSGKVKEELGVHISRARHCQIAELAALFSCCGQIISGTNFDGKQNFSAKFVTENLTVAKKYSILIRKAFHFHIEMSVRGHQYLIYILDPEDALTFFAGRKTAGSRADRSEELLQKSFSTGIIFSLWIHNGSGQGISS